MPELPFDIVEKLLKQNLDPKKPLNPRQMFMRGWPLLLHRLRHGFLQANILYWPILSAINIVCPLMLHAYTQIWKVRQGTGTLMDSLTPSKKKSLPYAIIEITKCHPAPRACSFPFQTLHQLIEVNSYSSCQHFKTCFGTIALIAVVWFNMPCLENDCICCSKFSASGMSLLGHVIMDPM